MTQRDVDELRRFQRANRAANLTAERERIADKQEGQIRELTMMLRRVRHLMMQPSWELSATEFMNMLHQVNHVIECYGAAPEFLREEEK
jgi:hypothetical protein